MFFALSGFVLMKIILGPARETGLVTVKETRSLDLPGDFSFDATVWNVVLVSVHLTLGWEKSFIVRYRQEYQCMTIHRLIGIVSSTVLFRSYLCGIIPVRFFSLVQKFGKVSEEVHKGTLAPPCVHLPGSSTLNDTWSPILQAITIHCPSRVLNKTGTLINAPVSHTLSFVIHV